VEEDTISIDGGSISIHRGDIFFVQFDHMDHMDNKPSVGRGKSAEMNEIIVRRSSDTRR
jgi:hypothetical protein